MRRVVVTGVGMVSPVGLNVKTSWDAALSGRSGIGAIQSFDASGLDVRIAGEVKGFDASALIGPKEVKRMTRFIQFAIAASAEAIQDSGLDMNSNTDSFGCSIGVGIGGLEGIHDTSLVLNQKGAKWVSPFFIPYVIANMASGLTSNHFGLRGPNLCTTTACTSGTHGVGEAWLYIKNHMADVMVCGGSESTVNPLAIAGFANMRALSRRNDSPETASRPFDANRDGFVLGEGAGILVLEELEHARRRGARIYAEVVGYGVSGDAHHLTAPPPRGEGAKRCMKQALQTAGFDLSDVDYVNAHGTSTPMNDLFESQAIEDLFGEHAKKLAVSSTKSVTGHCLGAAGGVEAVFLAKALQEQIAPPTANLETVDPDCHLDYIPREARPMKIRAAISNSFGFGGTNGCIAMKAF